MKNYWQQQRFYSLNAELRHTFGDKVIKLSVDGGFSCPNREVAQGCIFCSEKGSGDFAASSTLSIKEQLRQQKELLSEKWPNGKYIAYFQNFTNTYGDITRMRAIFEEALDEDIAGIAIATRADCLPDDVLDLLAELNERTFLWVEIGAQSTNPKTIRWMKRGYEHEQLLEGIKALHAINVRVCLHWIVGSPYDAEDDYHKAMTLTNDLGVWGVKIHMLHILKHTQLADWYAKHPFETLTEEEYCHIVVGMLKQLKPYTVIHRVTGDGPKDLLIAPRWILNKRSVLNGIDRIMREQDVFQGHEYKK